MWKPADRVSIQQEAKQITKGEVATDPDILSENELEDF